MRVLSLEMEIKALRGNAEKFSRAGEEIRSSPAYKGCRESGKEERKVWKEWSNRLEETQIWIVLSKPREKEFQGRWTQMSTAAEVTSSGGWMLPWGPLHSELCKPGTWQPTFQGKNNEWNKRTLTPLNTQSFKIPQLLLEIKKTAPNEMQ